MFVLLDMEAHMLFVVAATEMKMNQPTSCFKIKLKERGPETSYVS